MTAFTHFNYWVVVFLMMVGFYTIIARGNLVKKVVGLTIFQTSVFIFYISLSKIIDGTVPVLVGGVEHGEDGGAHGGSGGEQGELEAGTDAAAEAAGQVPASAAEWTSTALDGVVYGNPLPHVLILTAIVVGIATVALALALVVRINETYGTIEEDEIHEMDLAMEEGG